METEIYFIQKPPSKKRRQTMDNQQKLDDIIFAKRNKVYGAYVLRSDYSSSLLKSLFGTMALALGIAGICFWIAKKEIKPAIEIFNMPPDQTLLHTTPLDLSPKKSEQKRNSVTEKLSQNKEQAAIIISDSISLKSDTTQLMASIVNHKSGVQISETAGKDEGKGNGKKDFSGTGTENDTVVAIIADEYPEFEGGMAALNRWISSRLRYPTDAIEHSKQGKVHVKFIVDEQGKVQLPKAMNALGFGLEEEALRVVAGIPNFKTPAKVNGKPVKCYFVLPINFKLY